MKLKELPRAQRPREKLEKYGPEKLGTSELLAILLGNGTKGMNVVEMSGRILRKFADGKLAGASVADLKKTFGLGTAKACEIVACFELGRRLLQGKRVRVYLQPHDVWDSLRDIRDNKKEHFVVFFLDARSQGIRRETISIGTLNASIVHPREVFEPAILHSAAHVIVAHNHPSGDTNPSYEDIEITKRLVEAGKILGIEVVDHIIVSGSGFLSFQQKNLLG